jgi:hypothetical protein
MSPVEPPKFTPTPPARHAEENDGRMNLRHHDDPMQGGKKDQNRDRESPFDDTYDQMTLSVQALLDFLQAYADQPGQASPPPSHQASPSSPAASEYQTAPTNTTSPSVYAVRAYGHAAQTRPADITPSSTPAATQASEAQIMIDQLLRLRRRGLQGITLYKAENFLASLKNALAKAGE